MAASPEPNLHRTLPIGAHAHAGFALLLSLAFAACIPPERDNKPLPDLVVGGIDAADSGPRDVPTTDARAPDSADATAAPREVTGTDASPLPKGCTADSDCADKPAKVCRAWRCTPETGKCDRLANAPKGRACQDGDKCTSGQTCDLGGVCSGGKTASCDDGNACTKDTCNKLAGGCLHNPDDSLGCDDGDACTVDLCKEAACTTTSKDCADSDACTAESCDSGVPDKPGKGCIYPPADSGVPCDDGRPCTKDDTCAGLECAGSPMSAADCDDGRPCTMDSCPPLGEGCVHFELAGEVPACKDGNHCIEKASCLGGKCVVGAVKTCTGSSACFVMKCDPELGQCKGEDLPGGKDCKDEKKCLVGVCADGVCKKASEADCDDFNVCTLDKCVKGTGCTHTGLAEACSDGSACTANDTCKDGKCTGTATVDCDDADACTIDTCDPLTKKCAHRTAADGSPCDGGKTCSGGSCG